MKTVEIESLINEIVNSIENFNYHQLKEIINTENVLTNFPNKETFLEFIKSMMDQARERAIGDVRCNIAFYDVMIEGGFVSLNFHDESHLHPILRLEYKVENDSLVLSCPPF